MNDLALTQYLKTCCRRLNQQQTTLINDFALRTCGDVEVQPTSCVMTVELPERGNAIATITPIARYCPQRHVWRWAWADSDADASHPAIALQSLAQTTGLALFSTAEVQLSLEQVSVLLAIACSRLKASGYYCWRVGEEFVFFTIQSMAQTQLPLESSRNGRRLRIGSLQCSGSPGRNQLGLLPSPSIAPKLSAPTHETHGQNQPSLESLWMHTLCPSALSDVQTTVEQLKSLHHYGAS